MPCDTKLTTVASCVKRASVPPATQVSRKYWTRSPIGPGAVSAGKARKQRATNSGTISSAKGRSGKGVTDGGKLRGCKASRLLAVSGLKGHKPSDCRAVHAFLSNPFRPKLVARSRRSSGTTAQGGYEGAGDGFPTNSCAPRQGIGRRSPAVFSPTTKRDTQHRLKQYQELRPTALIIAVGNRGQSPGQGLLPGMPGKAWYMPQGRCLPNLDGCKRWQSSPAPSIRRVGAHCGRSSFGAAS